MPFIERKKVLRLLIVGTVAGIFSGVFGIGGGTVIVPALVLWLAYGEHEATGTSLAAIIVIASVAVCVNLYYGNVHFLEGVLIGLPAVPGVVLGTSLQQRLPSSLLSALFAVLLSVIAAKLLFSAEVQGSDVVDPDFVGVAKVVAVGVSAGVLAGLFGIGGGILFVPGLVLLLGLTQVEAEATSLLAIVPVAIVGVWRQSRHGNVRGMEGATIGVLAVVGTAIGVVIANAVSEESLRTAFALLSLLIAVQFIKRAVTSTATSDSVR